MFIKQFGLERSGTNVVKSLVEFNFGMRVYSNFPLHKHKHALPFNRFLIGDKEVYELERLGISISEFERIKQDVSSGHMLFIFSIRDVGSWVEGYYRYMKKRKKIENLNHEFVVDSLHRWKSINSTYMNFNEINPSKSIIVKHTDVVAGDRRWLEDIKKRLQDSDVSVVSDDVVSSVEGYAKMGTDLHRGMDAIGGDINFDRDKYASSYWVDELPGWAVQFILKWSEDISSHDRRFLNYISPA